MHAMAYSTAFFHPNHFKWKVFVLNENIKWDLHIFFWRKEWTWGNKENIKTFAARSFLVTSFHIRYFFACGGREMRDSEKAISDHCDVEDGGNFHFYDVMLLLAWVFLGFCREKWAMLLGMNMILLEVMFGLEVWRFLDTWSIAWGPL